MITLIIGVLCLAVGILVGRWWGIAHAEDAAIRRWIHERRVVGARRVLSQPGTGPSNVKQVRVARAPMSRKEE